MDKKRPQLSGDELHQLKWLLGGVLTLLAVGTVFYMEIEAWTLMALTSLATLATLARPTLPARVPRIVHTLAFPAIVAVFVADLWFTREVLPAMVRLDMMLLLYRNITYRARRDDLQVIVLGLFLIVVAGVLTVSLVFAAQILVYTACALAFLLAITLTDGAGGGPRGSIETPAWAAHVNWPQLFRRLREVADWRVVGLGGALFVGVVVVSGLLFLAIPRFQLDNGLFLDRFVSKKAKSGFSDTIRIGDVTEIQQDSSVALRVDVSDPAQLPATPYWRMFVLDQYNHGIFSLSPLAKVQALEGERTGVKVVGTATPRRGVQPRWTFYFEPGVSKYLPLLGEFATLEFGDAQNFRKSGELNIIALREEPVTMTAYRVEGFETAGRLRDPKFAQRWRAREQAGQARNLLQIRAATNDRDRMALTRLMQEVLPGAGGAGAAPSLPAAEFAARLGAWLRDRHGYSLQPKIPDGEGDPLVRWAASHESGHCELFAGSFVLLARVAGYPARVVTGFKGGTWNGYSGSFTVRNSDAHAWAEIFDVPTSTWLRADPLALDAGATERSGENEAARVAPTDRSWSARFDSLRVFWYRRIVSFDQRSQLATLKAVKDATENSGRWLRETVALSLGRVRAWLSAPWDVGRFIRLSYTAVLALGLAWWWHALGREWWRSAWRRGGVRRSDPVRREAGRWLAKLARAGSTDAELRQAQAALERVRFGARESWPEPERVFRQARRALRAARRRERSSPNGRGA
ncbi:MAG TPA: DUF3488 and transglutaminase-like domain-containing protein [Opitutaceae bacterium]|nr:DUF3488 and transglutaminase-like domain-containing protein [Opitutaceae bacterium]